jgi:hypothetical protein
MTAQTLTQNVPVLPSGFDSGNQNVIAPSPSQMGNGFLNNVDKVDGSVQNYLHRASTTAVYLMQLLGLGLPFNPDPITGKSLIATPKGGIVSLENASTSATEFYVALNAMAAGYADPSTDPTNWAFINYSAIATYTSPYADAGGTADAITAAYQSVIFPVLQDGFRVAVGIATPNLTTAPTLTVTLNGSVQTAYTIKKRSQTGANIPIAIGDLVGTCDFEFDKPNLCWIVRDPVSDKNNAGQLVVYAGSVIPPGVLQLPNAPATLSRTAYAALFAAIGTAWGNGDGSTTFGMPYIPAGYSILHYLGLGALGASTVGALLAHTHPPASPSSGFMTQGTGPFNTGAGTQGIQATTGSTGGPGNLAAGMLFNIGIRY